MIQKGRKIKYNNNIFTCVNFWCIGNKITKYIFRNGDGEIFERKAETINNLLENKIIEKL